MTAAGRKLECRQVSWPIRGSFAISRGSRTTAEVVEVTISDGKASGRGECVPYGRYGETLETVADQIRQVAGAIADGMDRQALLAALPAGAARNAVDCALWDLEAKLSGRRAFEIAGLAAPKPVITAYTISLGTVDAMAESARAAAHRPLLKLKLTGDGDIDRVAAVRDNAPNSRIIVDANEAWTPRHLVDYLGPMKALGVEMIEQPLPAGDDAALTDIDPEVPLCADESCHDSETLAGLVGKYQMINIKLDKTGGLTEALALRQAARDTGFRVMVGCMLGSSLAMAPGVLVGQGVDVVDLDGPLLLAQDRDPCLTYDDAGVHPPSADLWG